VKVSEVFSSIQGEALSVGRASTFIRLQGCNLRCYFCDTKYAWKDGKEYSIDDLVKEVKKYPTKLIVVTGGEPLLQRGELEKLANNLKGYSFEIETNGTLPPLKNCSCLIRYNVSPKLGSSLVPKEERYHPEILKEFVYLPSIFKFVAKNGSDWNEMEEIIKNIGIPKTRVWVMPEGQNDSIIKQRTLELVEKIKEKGYNLSPRLQIWLWGNKKGI